MQLVGGAFCWRSGMAVDADGSPRAYSADDKGLDFLANAGRPGNWWGIVTNASGLPVVQGALDPAPGYYVSPTSLVDRRYAASDPRRYVDSEKVPYVTLTRDMMQRGARMGDLAVVIYGAGMSAAICADFGPHPGEGSIALAREVGVNPDPRRGGVGSGVRYAVFKDSARGWPRGIEEFSEVAWGLFAAWGGFEKLALILGT